jgi:o-succinylbenzoate---CoA ligase
MPDLVAVDLAAGPGFVDALRRAWDAGNAVLPVDPRLPPPAVTALVEALRPSVVIDGGGSHRLDGGMPTEPGDALVIATSGTTGAPKGVVHTHHSIEASARATSARLDVDPRSDRWVACLPLAHVGGLSVVTRALITDTPCTILERFDPIEVERLARQGATLVSLVATALRRLDASGYRSVLVGGAAPPEDLPDNVITTYGMTETGSGIVYDGTPLEGAELRIGEPGYGSAGELHVRGPMLLRCYRDGTDPTDDDGWFPTGDAGHLEPDGTLTVHGRIDEVIVTGGEKVWPGPVERVLGTHPGVDQVAVWKRPDGEWGERVVAWVVPFDRSAPPDLDDLRTLVIEQLAPWSVPRELVIVSSLPRTPSGKVRRVDLR